MADFFQWLSSNSIATNTLVVSFGFLIISVILIFVIAFFQGREVVFWPPKVGTKPDKSEKGDHKKVEGKNDSDPSQDLVAQISSLEREIIDFRARFAFEEQIITDLPRDVVKKISALFSMRDNAVSENNRKKFLETQLDEKEIDDGSSRGYISTSKLTTSILRLISMKSKLNESVMKRDLNRMDETSPIVGCQPIQGFSYQDIDIDYVVLVREDYERKGKYSHLSYLAYYITTTKEGLKIVALKSIIE